MTHSFPTRRSSELEVRVVHVTQLRRIADAKGRTLPHVELRADQGYRQDIVTAIASGEAYGTPAAEGASYLDVLEVRNVAGEVALAVEVASDLKASVAPSLQPSVALENVRTTNRE